MVHGKMTGIGCAYKVCSATNALTVTCLYNKIGYYTNGVMFENGTPCTSAADCTTYPGDAQLSEVLEGYFISKSAKCFLRSRLAIGLEPDALGGNAPKASQMLKMVYDCDVEASAIKHSQKCVYEHSASSDRPGLGENLYMTTALNVDKVTTAAESSQMWWDELKEYGVGPENNLTRALWDRPGMQIGHYSQVRTHFKLDFKVLSAFLRWLGIELTSLAVRSSTLIYTMGEPCTSDAGCPGSYTCSTSEGLCNVV
ncbi:unnamed protein product [Cylicostephanus goldi]|uniref:SCP domain-containing protein n=1 Tax=Cylicostephanus goldi TaxID=71465 RepID=A0A3P6RT02_CYLGO|nr:unnamed protein product [Cylicostephanus goldi]